jgi:hypothetical protein
MMVPDNSIGSSAGSIVGVGGSDVAQAGRGNTDGCNQQTGKSSSSGNVEKDSQQHAISSNRNAEKSSPEESHPACNSTEEVQNNLDEDNSKRSKEEDFHLLFSQLEEITKTAERVKLSENGVRGFKKD